METAHPQTGYFLDLESVIKCDNLLIGQMHELRPFCHFSMTKKHVPDVS